MGITAAIVGAVAAIGGTTYSAVSYENNRKEQKKIRDDQEQKQIQAQADLQQKQKNEQSNDMAMSARASARQRQRMNAAAAQGRSGTILTSPLGIPNGDQQVTGKTLLGS